MTCTHPGPVLSPRGGVSAELPQPLGVVTHGSIEHTDRVIAAVGVRLHVKLPEGQRDHLMAGHRAEAAWHLSLPLGMFTAASSHLPCPLVPSS